MRIRKTKKQKILETLAPGQWVEAATLGAIQERYWQAIYHLRKSDKYNIETDHTGPNGKPRYRLVRGTGTIGPVRAVVADASSAPIPDPRLSPTADLMISSLKAQVAQQSRVTRDELAKAVLTGMNFMRQQSVALPSDALAAIAGALADALTQNAPLRPMPRPSAQGMVS